MLHVVLIEPEIPQNTGNIARTCAATGSELHLVKPLGFKLEDKYLKRAGLDYWPLVKVHVHEDFAQSDSFHHRVDDQSLPSWGGDMCWVIRLIEGNRSLRPFEERRVGRRGHVHLPAHHLQSTLALNVSKNHHCCMVLRHSLCLSNFGD